MSNPAFLGLGGGQLLLATLKTLQEIAHFSRSMYDDDDRRRPILGDLTMWCAMIRNHSSYIGTRSDPSMDLLVGPLLDQVESVLAPDFLDESASKGLQGKVRSLNTSWKNIRNRDQSSKITFIQASLALEPLQTERVKQLIAGLSAFEAQIRSSDTEEGEDQERQEFAPVKKVREPSYAVWKAAQSIFKALVACKECSCQPTHDLCARLRLGTYRKPHDLEEENEFCFDVLLATERDFHEARIRAAKESVVKWAIDADKDGAKTTKNKPKPRSMKVKQLCEQIAKMRTLTSAHRLELKLAREQLFKLQSEISPSPLDKTKSPISLHQLLEGGPRSFTERTRRVLAVILSFAVLHLHNTHWLPPAWDSSNVLFFSTTSSTIPIKPFIQTPITDIGSHSTLQDHITHAGMDGSNAQDMDPDDIDPDDMDPDDMDPDDCISHQCPSLVALAIMLMEVYFATTFGDLADRYGVNVEERGEVSSNLRYINANRVFQACKGEIPENSQFLYALEMCLDPAMWEDEDGEALDNATLRARIYEEVVLPLETELSEAYSSIPIEDLDTFAAQKLDLANWDQTIKAMGAQSALLQSLPDLRQPIRSPSPRTASPATSGSRWLSPEPPGIFHQQQQQYFWSQSDVSSQHSITSADYTASKFFDDESLPGPHAAPKKTSYLVWKSRYQQVYENFIPVQPSTSPVKVAILDSGIDLNHDRVSESIKGKYNWIDQKRTRVVTDHTGHGTFVAGLILDYAPDAELYVAKIADRDPSDPRVIAKAITHAIDVWNVDIITMSFGFPTSSLPGYAELERALKTAYSRDVLMFAAASNNGGKLGRSFPAREPTVIAVHSTDTDGNRSPFSPTPIPEDLNFATVGEGVESAWPHHLCDQSTNPSCVEYKSGTSYATPIVAGIAAFLLTYARIHLSEDLAERMRSHKGMRAVLRRIAEKTTGSGGYTPRDGYHFVDLSLYGDSLFGKDKRLIDLTLADLLHYG